MEKICVYTSVTGNYDYVKELSFLEDGVDYFCFTDNHDILSNTWQMVYLENIEMLDEVRLARKIKILGHELLKPYDIWVWVDGSLRIGKSVLEFIKTYTQLDKYDFASFRHSKRRCIYDEAEECVRNKRDGESIIRRQMAAYRRESYPEKNGLIESGVLIRKAYSPEVKETMGLWFDQLLKYSYRDQLSFNYCCWKTGLEICQIPLKAMANEWFTWEGHLKKPDLRYLVFHFSKEEIMPEYKTIGSYQFLGDRWIASFCVPLEVEKIRFDIGREVFLDLKEFKAESNGLDLEATPEKVIGFRERNLFLNCEPHAYINTSGRTSTSITVTFRIDTPSVPVLSEFFNRVIFHTEAERSNLMSEKNELANESAALKKEVDRLCDEVQRLERENQEILCSACWKFTKPLRVLLNLLRKNTD